MSARYQQLLELLKRWPLDKSKGVRDYGFHLRNLAKSSFPSGDIFSGTEDEKNEKFQSLLRLADNKYKKMYSSNKTTAATGLSIEQLHEAMSQSFVDKYLK